MAPVPDYFAKARIANYSLSLDGSQGEGIVEEVAALFDDAAVGAAADQDQAKGRLLQPGLGEGQMEENAVGVGVGQCKSGVESLERGRLKPQPQAASCPTGFPEGSLPVFTWRVRATSRFGRSHHLRHGCDAYP
jgi:hypothetical protein